MSHSFYVEGPAPFISVLAGLGLEDGSIGCREEEKLADVQSFPDEYFFHFHRPRGSTRGVEVGYANNAFSVRFLALSSPEDYELGFQILERVAGTRPVQPEDSDAMPLAALRAQYGREWIAQMIRSHVDLVFVHGVGKPHEVMSLEGPVRSVHVGPRLRAELAQGPERTLVERALARVRKIQYIDLDDGCYVANVLVASPPNGREFRTTAWAPGVRYLFPKVEYFTLLSGKGGHVSVPHEALFELAGERARYLDEEQVLVEAIDGAEWDALYARAERMAVDPAEPPAKSWWKFWK